MDEKLYTFENPDYKNKYRHTTSHILAQAVKRLYPRTKLAIGPAIEDGFYYDFDSETVFTPEILENLEAEMRKICKEKIKLERFELPKSEAIELMKDEPYKLELINDLPEGEIISFYKQDDFTDLCAGPHMDSTGRIKGNAIKLTSCTGAYWRGDSKNKMLQRIYGTCFPSKSELDEYIERQEEAKKRDHRRIGKDLDLFMLCDEGPGFPFFLPNGVAIRNELESFWKELHRQLGYQEIRTPQILNEELWHRSGHWDHYHNNMYFTKIDEEDYAVKPMNCPGAMICFKRRPWSYKDLPLRMGELGIVHRHELSGALHGLFRVRSFTQDDAHIFMTEDMMEDEILGVIKKIDSIYNMFGFKYHIELSTCPEDFIGSDEIRERSENVLKNVLEKNGREYIVNPGDGAFYGPKIDFHLEDAIGRTWQCGTIQLDFEMPERFELEYIGADSQKHRPIMIHTVALGSIERFIGVLTEHFAGAFPLWLAPVQVKVMPITDRTADYAQKVADKLSRLGIRVQTDTRSEKIGYKIREAQLQKIPYMLVLGDKEAEAGTVAVRTRVGVDLGALELDDVIGKILEEIKTKAI